MSIESELGNLFSIHDVNQNRQFWRLVFAMIGGVGFVAFIAAAGVPGETDLIILIMLGALLLGTFSCMYLFLSLILRSYNTSLELYDFGIAITNSDHVEHIRWDDILSYRFQDTNMHLDEWTKVELFLDDNKKIIIYSDYEQWDFLFNVLSVRIQEALTTRYLALIHRGKTVTIGSAEISAKGISQGETCLYWNDVQRLEVGNHAATILRTDGRLGMVLDNADRAHGRILYPLLDLMIQSKQRSQ